MGGLLVDLSTFFLSKVSPEKRVDPKRYAPKNDQPLGAPVWRLLAAKVVGETQRFLG